jgi:hypothetical protein
MAVLSRSVVWIGCLSIRRQMAAVACHREIYILPVGMTGLAFLLGMGFQQWKTRAVMPGGYFHFVIPPLRRVTGVALFRKLPGMDIHVTLSALMRRGIKY